VRRRLVVPIGDGLFQAAGELEPELVTRPIVAEQAGQPSAGFMVGIGTECQFALEDAAQVGGDTDQVLYRRISASEDFVLERVGDGAEEPAGVRRVLHVASLSHR
jgi:hypothetical protein